jgi:2,4-dienoyl-CoA reductase-like NADH-dependent reductase (Old Yellow Enzyme family)/thioredoxin reductase
MVQSLEKVFSPGEIGSLRVKNRLMMAPVGTNSSTWTGAVTDRLVHFYAERAQGGVGLITVQFSYVHPSGQTNRYGLGIYDDALVPGLRRIADAVHQGGAHVAIQIAHGGRRSKSAITGRTPMGPSAIPYLGGEIPRALSLAEMEQVTAWFVQAARRAREAGFDAVMLHLANGYLLNEFISPSANQRTDTYGGSTERRARLPLEILQDIRRELGTDFPVLCRLCVDEGLDEGLSLQEGVAIARLLAGATADAIEVVSGVPETMHLIGPPMALPRGFRVVQARAVKDALSIPVIASGRISDPQLAEEILRKGDADFISMGRPLLADPDLPNKARAGHMEDICPCIACNEGCNQRLYADLNVSCVTNPRAGREDLFPAGPVERPKKVLVAGGGPAGMMAAVTAARRGHRVTLCERSARLGGQLLMGSVPPYKEEIRHLMDYLVIQVKNLGIWTRMETTVTERLVVELAPDVAIVATGAKPLPIRIPGGDASVASAWDVLRGTAALGKKVAVVGGGEVGCELAEHLARLGKDVVIVEALGEIAINMEPRGRRLLLQRLQALGVEVLTHCLLGEVHGRTLFYIRGGMRHRMERVDSIVIAVGSVAEDGLADALKATGVLVYPIGDCIKPRRILEAIREGFEAAFSL